MLMFSRLKSCSRLDSVHVQVFMLNELFTSGCCHISRNVYVSYFQKCVGLDVFMS